MICERVDRSFPDEELATHSNDRSLSSAVPARSVLPEKDCLGRTPGSGEEENRSVGMTTPSLTFPLIAPLGGDPEPSLPRQLRSFYHPLVSFPSIDSSQFHPSRTKKHRTRGRFLFIPLKDGLPMGLTDEGFLITSWKARTRRRRIEETDLRMDSTSEFLFFTEDRN